MKERPVPCHAAFCPRRVKRDVIFCEPHLETLPEKDRARLGLNQVPPSTAPKADRAALAKATNTAVKVIAAQEGRSRELGQLLKEQASLAPPTNPTDPTPDRDTTIYTIGIDRSARVVSY